MRRADARRAASAGPRCSRTSSIDPMRCADRLDWPAKLRLLEGYRSRDGAGLGRFPPAPGRPAVLRRASGQGARPLAGGPLPMQRLLTDDEVTRGDDLAAGWTPGRFLPRRVPAAVPGPGGCGVVGLGRVRPRTREPGAHPDDGAAARARASTWARSSSGLGNGPAVRGHDHRRLILLDTPPGDPECHRRGVAFWQAPATSRHRRATDGHQGHRRAAERPRARARRPTRSRPRSTPTSPSATRR